MVNTAGKLEQIYAMYDAGLLCKCSKLKFKELGSGLYERILVHKKGCNGLKKAKELMFG